MWIWDMRKKISPPKLDLKGQYDRLAELDQLLNWFSEKSAEFPDFTSMRSAEFPGFYDSEEQMSLCHAAEYEKDRAGQGVLTEEDERELENLAVRDLELKKIAESSVVTKGSLEQKVSVKKEPSHNLFPTTSLKDTIYLPKGRE